MNELLQIHNLFRRSGEQYLAEDPQLRKLAAFPIRYESDLITVFSRKAPGIYTLSGGRQIGKTTLIKQVIARVLHAGIAAGKNILYLTGEVLPDHTDLLREIREFVTLLNSDSPAFLFVDEISYIHEWHRAVKFAADAGYFEKTVVVLTGSDMVFLKEMIKRLPGRRGRDSVVDYHYHPVDFREYAQLTGEAVHLPHVDSLHRPPALDADLTSRLYSLLDRYLRTGGYLTAINDLAQSGDVSAATMRTYVDWIYGDMARRNKHRRFVDDVLGGILKRYGSQLTWNTLAADLSIQHHKTVFDYCDILQDMDVIRIHAAFQEHTRSAAPKKARKIYFTDPFIARAVAQALTMKPPSPDNLIEGVVVGAARKAFPSYYIKKAGEIDLVYVDGDRFVPIEIKNTSAVKPVHLKMLKTCSRGILACRVISPGTIDSVSVLPIPWVLLFFCDRAQEARFP